MKPYRKIYRLFGLIFPLLYFYFSKDVILIILGVAAGLYLLLDVVRFLSPSFNKKLFKTLSFILKEKEKKNLSGSSWFLIGSFLTILFFDKSIAIVALFFLVFGDGAAEIVGSKFGRVKVFGKSLEGSFACFVVCFLIGFILMRFIRLSVLFNFVGALSASFIEILPLRLDDNLTIPLFVGIVLTILSA